LSGSGVWLGLGAAEGDFEAFGLDLVDVVGDLAAGGGLALVVVRAEVLIPQAGAGQQLVVDLQLGVAERDHGFGLAAAAGQPPVAGALAGLGLPGGDGGLAEQAAARDYLEKLAHHYGLTGKVTFTGFRDDMADVWAQNELLVLPSREESMPIAVLEAM